MFAERCGVFEMLAAGSMLWLDGKRVCALLRPDLGCFGVGVHLRVAGEQDLHFAFPLLFSVLVEAMMRFAWLDGARVFNCDQIECAT